MELGMKGAWIKADDKDISSMLKTYSSNEEISYIISWKDNTD